MCCAPIHYVAVWRVRLPCGECFLLLVADLKCSVRQVDSGCVVLDRDSTVPIGTDRWNCGKVDKCLRDDAHLGDESTQQ